MCPPASTVVVWNISQNIGFNWKWGVYLSACLLQQSLNDNELSTTAAVLFSSFVCNRPPATTKLHTFAPKYPKE